MKTKIKLFMMLILAALLALQGYIAWYGDGKKVRDVILAVPNTPINTPADLAAIEDKNGEEYLLTYVSNNPGTVRALNKNYAVVLKGVNYLYPYVMGSKVLGGAFFTKAEWNEEPRLAVMNEKAAFDIFGGLDIAGGEIHIGGDIFTVVGVMDDGDKKNLNIYVPVGLVKNTVDSFAVLIDAADQTPEAAVENMLKQLNITGNQYDFYNLNKFTDSILIKLYLSLYLFLLAAIGLFLVADIKMLGKKMTAIKNESQLWDWGELLRKNKRNILMITVLSLLAAAGIGAVLVCCVQIEGYCLTLWDLDIIIRAGYASGFTDLIYLLNKRSICSWVVFTVFWVVFIVFIGMLLLNGNNEKPGCIYQNQSGEMEAYDGRNQH